MPLLETAVNQFETLFGERPTHAGIAPGRVEVLGNHTDYNEGFILSAAIDRHVVLAGRAIDGPTAKVYSPAFNEGQTIKVNAPEPVTRSQWVNYIAGVVDQLNQRGVHAGAFEVVVVSDIPLGAGLSSSAALEVATANFLQQLYPFSMEPTELALLCQAAENQFAGVNCGILDQFSSVMGKSDHLIFLDCRELSQFSHVPLSPEVCLVLANTHAPHSLQDGQFNRFRETCHAAARRLAERLDRPVTHLRDVSEADLSAVGEHLEPELHARARHVITENARVLASRQALAAADFNALGAAMSASHASSRDDFGNSCTELDTMQSLAEALPGCIGARLSGGGFGGCTVNLVTAEHAEEFSRQLSSQYFDSTGITPDVYICAAANGARGIAL